MGALLREVLRTLCVGNRWSYAVFWKVGCHNPKLLIWEECYYESLPCSAPLSKSGIGEAGLTSGAWFPAGDKVGLLIKKMMNHNQFNIVGEGIVGRAAFTGNHEWILGNNYIGHAHPPEVLNELYHQFSAGMQTVAVVPVSPHGVVQLGSSLAMLENMGFVNDVKSLILQLGCVPGALLSDSGLATDSMERIGVPVSVEMPVPMQLLGMNEVCNSAASMDFGYNQHIVSSNASGTVGQPSHSPIRGAQENLDYTPSIPNVSMKSSPKILAKSCNGQSALKFTLSVKPNNSHISQQVKSVFGAETICLDHGAWIKQLADSNNLKPGFSHQPLIGQPHAGDNILSLFEQKITGDVGCHSNSHNLKAATKGGGSNFYSGELLPTSGGESSYGQSSQVVPVSVTCSLLNSQKVSDFDQSCAQLARVGLQNVGSPRPEDILFSSLFDQSSANDLLSGSYDLQYHSADLKHHKIELPASRERPNNDLFAAFKSPSNTVNEHISMGEKMSGVVNDCLKHASGIHSTVSASSKYESAYTKPLSGDDLYDILGVDYRNKLDKSELNNLLVHGSGASTQNVGGYSSTVSNKQKLHPGFCSANEASDSLFSVTSADHLLDAVVSGVCSTTKQSSGDNMSSRTTLTNISNSSDPSGSSMCGKLSMLDPVERELSDLPKYMEKAGNVTSSSFKSGSSNNDSGSCSRTTLAYGSQVASWVGHNVRHDSSVLPSFPKKNDEINKSHRKKLKPGENPRPRPKDRQMIQDRVKELREIVPNGAKCSIDALLERTIKHMLFLQSVTKHADKLKQTGESKLISKDGRLLLKDNFEGGKTWAFEVGSQSTFCPIIVEDLNPPRQLLVEMLCEEQGFFLEIADLIRGLGLSILKGVMESRNNKIWAQFAVEADRDVTRREVFMSLVHLLEQMKGGFSSLGNAMENDLRVHHALHSATSIPATGRPGTLQ